MNEILLIPSLRDMDGSGHTQRCLRLAADMPQAKFFIPDNVRERFLRIAGSSFASRIQNDLQHPEVIVLDAPWISPEEMQQYMEAATVIAIDLGGECRSYADYLIDTLPYPGDELHHKYFHTPAAKPSNQLFGLLGGQQGHWQGPNQYDSAFLPLPAKGELRSSPPKKLLVSFGASDPSGLSSAFAQALARTPEGSQIDGVIVSSLGSEEDNSMLPPSWKRVDYLSDIRSQFSRFDMVICAYGLTAWEAQYAGLPTLLVDASFYHAELARRSGFLSVTPQSLPQILPQLLEPELLGQLREQVRRVQTIAPRSLSAEIQSLELPTRPICPGCGHRGLHKALARDSRRTYVRCGSCSTAYLVRATPHDINYDNSYFAEDYCRQYGKTYLEDFAYIKSLAAPRLELIGKHAMTESQNPALLDIGCAYGPFLQAASQAGYQTQGIDINEDAAEYVRTTLGIDALAGDIQQQDFRGAFQSASFDVITMWYVIEHFSDLREILSWIHSLLKPWGLFAFATPNSRGISGNGNLAKFLLNGPDDHFTIWDQRQTDQLLSRYGFQLQHWRSIGHHAERFPGVLSKPFMKGVTGMLSQTLSLGDSLEAYALRLPDTPNGVVS